MSLFFAPDQWKVPVNYRLSLDQMIAAGKFEWVDRNYSATAFPIRGRGSKSLPMRIMCIDAKMSDITTKDVLDSIKSHAMRPARLEELLALAAVDPAICLTRRVFAIGTMWRDSDDLVHVPKCNLSSIRRLHLHPIRREPWWSSLSDCFPCIPL